MGELLLLWKVEQHIKQRENNLKVTPFTQEDFSEIGELPEEVKTWPRAKARSFIFDALYREKVRKVVLRGAEMRQCASCLKSYASDEPHNCFATGQRDKKGRPVLVTQKKGLVQIRKGSQPSIVDQQEQIRLA